jgi:hypothetical protein
MESTQCDFLRSSEFIRAKRKNFRAKESERKWKARSAIFCGAANLFARSGKIFELKKAERK